ncbi:trifunctional purine biosynthetic protein adenosine-3-like [Limosa lapponica baueri]|uniref:Trifunctional purine biosynthetic protein adenosine-3-like n=1 Tax=Limosa lapponica baueri TaxID=1758121 RepID=A0A2I0U3U0_LIMLA|nr:trifunctional purine biosynthetic protein adenosine-3-like [Limosa lapponica baueri]
MVIVFYIFFNFTFTFFKRILYWKFQHILSFSAAYSLHHLRKQFEIGLFFPCGGLLFGHRWKMWNCEFANLRQSTDTGLMADRVLVIGSGGREHALAWKLAQSPHVKHVFVAPGNAGTADNGKISNSAVLVSNHTIVTQFCKDHNIGLVLVGQEALLAAGIVDDLKAAGVRCFGPSAKAAQLASNTSFAKAFLDRHGIPTARWKAFTNPQEACRFIISTDFPARVVRARGPAARKEVTIAASKEEACRAVQEIMQDRMFGEMVVIEELLQGEELSCLCFTDGVTVASMPPAQAHKRLLDGDQGPNTGGMGAYCPVPQVPEVLLEKINAAVLQHVVDSMRQEGTAYVGVLQTGLMLTKDGLKILNFKCQFGDPQCQVILPLLKNDFYEVIQATIDGKLCSFMPAWSENSTAVCVVMASPGYPGDCDKGMEVTGLLQAKELGLEVFHAGTTLKDGRVVTSGGRVLSITAVKEDLMKALGEANRGVAAIHFKGATYRKDIGHRGIRLLKHSLGLIYKERRVEAVTSDVLFHQPETSIVSGTRSDPKVVTDRDELNWIAQVCKRHDTIGQDLVAMCVNAILAQGAEPLFFLNYFACGKLDVEVTETIKEGIVEACRNAGCAFLGREMAEVAGMYSSGEYDLAGFVVGAVERGQMLLGLQRAEEEDVLIGLASSGIHGPGFSIIRKILLMSSLHYSSPAPGSCGDKTLGDILLTPAKTYSPSLLPVLRSGHVKAFAFIAEEGLLEGISRILPEHVSAVLDALSWKIPEIFCWLYKEGNLSEEEMAQTFNCGIGAVLVVQKDLAQHILKDVQRHEEAWLIGKVVAPCHTEALQLSGPQHLLNSTAVESQHQPRKNKVKVAVLISGTGKILNVSPSLFPPIKDGNAHQQALQSGFKVTGCTVHFVLEESSPKAVIHQEPVSVKADDTEETLSERVKEAECRAFPIALQLVASGAVQLGADGKTYWKQESQSLCLQEEKRDCTSSLLALGPQENDVV